MQCNEIRNYFADYLAENLGSSTQEEFSRHLKECPACHAELEALTDLWVKLGSVPAGPPASPDLEVRLRASAEAYEAEVQEAGKGRRVWKRLAAVAAIAAAIAIAVLIPVRMLPRAPAVLEGMASSRKIEFGEVVRSGDVAGRTLVLADSSRVEMRAKSELLLERAEDGVRILLHHGGIIVNAAKQRNGHLYVKTKDVTVSVVGTVFLVNAEEEGSRVAVVEGEVRVQQQGATEKKLLPGDQMMTEPLMEWQPVSEAISWSQAAEMHLALLQQSVVSPAEPREAFEVVSVRQSAATASVGGGGEGRRGVGVPRRNPRTPGEPCNTRGEPIVDPRRFDAANTTLHALVAWTYGLDCEAWRGGSEFLFGGPGWTRDQGFDIQAVIPEGSASYTADQFRAHNAPKLQEMLQSMLEDRFKLVVHREMKEMQVYVLTVAKGGPKLLAKPVNPNPVSPRGPGLGGTLNVGMEAWKEGDNPCCAFTFNGTILAHKQSMAQFAGMLKVFLGQPVLDRTGLTGAFNYYVSFHADGPPTDSLVREIQQNFGFRFSPATRSIFGAIEQDFGLHLESTKEKIEVLVIDRVERPSEN